MVYIFTLRLASLSRTVTVLLTYRVPHIFLRSTLGWWNARNSCKWERWVSSNQHTAEQYGDNATSRMDKKRTLTIQWQWINWDSPLCCGIHFVHPDIDYSITVILFRFLSYHSTVHRSFTTEICRNNHCYHHLHLNLHPHPFHPTRKPTTSQNGKKRLPPSCSPLEFDSEPAFMSSNPLHG